MYEPVVKAEKTLVHFPHIDAAVIVIIFSSKWEASWCYFSGQVSEEIPKNL